MRTSLLLLPLLIFRAQSTPIPIESVSGDKLWISSSPKASPENHKPFRITVWFDKQLLGDSAAYQRRVKEFSKAKRTQLRTEVIAALKKESSLAFDKAAPTLKDLKQKGLISDIDPHWIVNGFTCSTQEKGIQAISKLSGVRKIFIRQPRDIPVSKTPPMPKIPFVARPRKAHPKNIPWYTTKLEADKVWRELGFAGQGTLNVIHDKNFIVSDHLQRSIYRNPKEIAGNGKDDDGNGFVDDVHGYNFDLQSNQLYTRPFTGNPKDRKILHGTNCANIVSGSGDGKDRPAFGIAPLSQWAGVINLGGIEQSVEWAIEQGADTYSMSFTRTPFSCIGPVTWATEHYRDGTLQKPEVCAFNAKVVSQFLNGKIVPGLLNGNSYAGPMFCGAISLMLSADPDLLPSDLKEIITDTATDVGPEGIDPQTGHGLINCYKAVKEVQQRKQLRK